MGDLPDPLRRVLGDGAVHGLRLVADRLVAGRLAVTPKVPDALPEPQLGDLVLGHVDFEEALRVARGLLLQLFHGLLDLVDSRRRHAGGRKFSAPSTTVTGGGGGNGTRCCRSCPGPICIVALRRPCALARRERSATSAEAVVTSAATAACL